MHKGCGPEVGSDQDRGVRSRSGPGTYNVCLLSFSYFAENATRRGRDRSHYCHRWWGV